MFASPADMGTALHPASSGIGDSPAQRLGEGFAQHPHSELLLPWHIHATEMEHDPWDSAPTCPWSSQHLPSPGRGARGRSYFNGKLKGR